MSRIQLSAGMIEYEDSSRIVLASCDAFDNFPPGLTGRTLVLTGKLSRYRTATRSSPWTSLRGSRR